MLTLLLMRHAKSDWDADYTLDHDRPLNGRGERSARLMGRVLTGLDQTPDHVMSSTALRARTTAQLAKQSGEWSCLIDLESGFYGSGPDAVLSFAAGAPDVQSLMLVGHQPTWSSLVQRLTGNRSEMKTASVAVIEMTIDKWSQLEQGRGVLADLHQARSYYGSEWDDHK